jgi:hypothetical protein
MQLKAFRPFALLTVVLSCIVAINIAVTAQTPAKGPAIRYTATTDNVSGAGETIKINLVNWSTDAERDQILAAWTLTATTPAAAARGGGGRGAGGGRGGRGGGANAAPAPAETRESSLAAALQKTPTAGILWTSETTGYSVHYAYHLSQPDGGERIILATDRRLGGWNNLWKPAGSAKPNEYEFSVIELRLNPKGEGEGKVSVTGTVAADKEAKTIALDGYSTLPVVLKGVKRQ